MLGHRSRLLVPAFLGFALASFFVAPARAAYDVDVYESGGDVAATGSGTIDTTALTNVGIGAGEAILNSNQVVALFGTSLTVTADLYSGISGPSTFGTALTGEPLASSGAGDLVGVTSGAGVGVPAYPLLLWVPQNYVSSSPLASSDIWAGQSFASLGLAPGTYVWTWGDGADADSFTLNIGTQPVPEPSSLAMLGLGALAVAGYARRRARD